MKEKSFREWFTNDYLMQSPLSNTLVLGNKSISERQERICKVAELMIKSGSCKLEDIREKVAIEFFVTMRCSLDYINYATLLINAWEKAKNRKV